MQAAVFNFKILFFSSHFPIVPDDQDRTGHKNRRVRSGDDADEQCQDKEMDIRAAEQKQRKQYKDNCQRSIDRTNDCLADTVTDDVSKTWTRPESQIFANSVKNYDRVMNWETKHSQHGRDEQAINFHALEMPKDRESAKHDK